MTKDGNMFLHSCISCVFKTNEFNSLMTHIRENHKTPSSTIKCDMCGFEATTPNALETHISSFHNPVSMKTCNLCAFQTEEIAQMKDHIEITHCSNTNYFILKKLQELSEEVK